MKIGKNSWLFFCFVLLLEQLITFSLSVSLHKLNLSKKKVFSTQKLEFHITADQGLIERYDNRITLSGNVVLFHGNVSEVFTETAIYDSKNDTLTIPKPLRMIREGHTMHGSGLTYQVYSGKLNLNNPLLLRHD